MLALLAAFYFLPWNDVDRTPLPLHLLMTITAVSIVLLGLQIEVAGLLPRSATLKYLGDASYSLYLFHLFAIATAWAVAKQLFDTQQPLAYLGCAAAAIVAGIGFSLVCHHLIETRRAAHARRDRRLDPLRRDRELTGPQLCRVRAGLVARALAKARRRRHGSREIPAKQYPAGQCRPQRHRFAFRYLSGSARPAADRARCGDRRIRGERCLGRWRGL
jgi:peptidoglycan/LPS O-acetylase OafA/YrhL